MNEPMGSHFPLQTRSSNMLFVNVAAVFMEIDILGNSSSGNVVRKSSKVSANKQLYLMGKTNKMNEMIPILANKKNCEAKQI